MTKVFRTSISVAWSLISQLHTARLMRILLFPHVLVFPPCHSQLEWFHEDFQREYLVPFASDWCKEGRSPFLFKDEEDEHDETNPDASDHDSDSSPDLCHFEIYDALTRSNSELEARASWEELESLAMSEGPGPSRPSMALDPKVKAESAHVDPAALSALINIVKSKMKKILFGNRDTCRFDVLKCFKYIDLCCKHPCRKI